MALAGESAPSTVTLDYQEPHPVAAATTSAYKTAEDEKKDQKPGAGTRPGLAAGQLQYVFHELHADIPNAVCAVCNGQC